MNTTKCGQVSCPVNEGGLCLEGFDLTSEECPHVLFDDENDEELEADDETLNNEAPAIVENPEKGITHFSGDAMNNSELHAVTFAHLAKLILIMGEPDSGKTTLLASIFNMFQKGNYAGFMFAGSKTQIGFEKRCHLARMASGRTTPEIERTSSNVFTYLHLAVRDVNLSNPIRHLLFADVSGERFRLARDSDDELERLTILKQAKEIFYVVNGEHLADLVLRQATKSNVIRMLNRIQQNYQGTHVINNINIIVSKWDKVIENSAQEKVEKFFFEPLLIKFPQFIKRVEKVATRSGITGLDTFLQTCAKPVFTVTNTDPNKKDLSNREFYRLQTGH